MIKTGYNFVIHKKGEISNLQVTFIIKAPPFLFRPLISNKHFSKE